MCFRFFFLKRNILQVWLNLHNPTTPNPVPIPYSIPNPHYDKLLYRILSSFSYFSLSLNHSGWTSLRLAFHYISRISMLLKIAWRREWNPLKMPLYKVDTGSSRLAFSYDFPFIYLFIYQ